MSHPLKHPKAKELLGRVAQPFRAEDTFIVRDSNMVFVCGGPMGRAAMREKFLTYSKTELTHLRIFLAEIAQKDYVQHPDPEFHNVAEFEDIMAEVSACVIIFPESPGSFAELGYFSKSEKLRKKMLIVNNENLQGQDSFVALGPIQLVDKYSIFRPTIQLSYSDDPNFGLIKERLDKRFHTKNRQRLNAKKYRDLTTQKKLFSLFEIVRMFQALPGDSVEHAFRSIWGNAKRTELHRLLSILVAADYVRRIGDEITYFCINRASHPFLEFESFDINVLSLEILDFYETNFPDIADVVRGLDNDP